MSIRVAIVEDTEEIRNGLAILINGSDGFECTETYSNGREAMDNLPGSNPDVVLMDIHMPGINGIECVKALKPLLPATQFVMSTVYEDDDSIFQSLKAGASGYLLKKTQPVRILDSIREVYEGGSPMSWQIARKVISSFHQQPASGEQQLSDREMDILQQLAKGLRYKEIADHLFISTDTVRSHVRRIYEKLQVHSRTEALNKVFPR